MQESAKAILTILNNLKFEAYYNGDKCRNELYNEMYKGKGHLKSFKTTIVTSAKTEEICKYFPNNRVDENNPMVVYVNFANEEFQIESFHTEQYYIKEPEQFLSVPIVEYANTLDEDFNRKVFTINCVAKNKENENFYGVSARLDMTDKVIKTISPSKDVFYEYPIRTLQAFELMSLTGFKIDKEVLKNIKSTMRYLRFMPSNQVGDVLRKIIVGKYASDTFKLMQKIGILNSKCLVNNEKQKILLTLQECKPERFEVLDKFKKSSDIELELWSVLFDDEETARRELSKFNSFSELELHTICWLMKNRNMCEQNSNMECRKVLYDSITEFELEQGIHYLKDLVLQANHIYARIHDKDDRTLIKEKTKRLFFNLCARPYFANQLTIDIEYSKKKALIPKLLFAVKYPVDDEKMREFIINNKFCETCDFVNTCNNEHSEESKCTEGVLKWLGKPKTGENS